MIDEVISKINEQFPGLRALGISELVELDGVSMPAILQDERGAISAEVDTIYHRILSNNSESDEVDYSTKDVLTLAYECRAVILIDTAYKDEQSAIVDLSSKLVNNSYKTIRRENSLLEASSASGDALRGREAWEEEFVGIEYSLSKIVAVDYTVTLKGFPACLEC